LGNEAAEGGGTASQQTGARPADSPTPDAVDAVRNAASQLLDATFASLSEGHVLPRPRFAPWIRMAHDYYGDMLRGGGDFDRALKAAWPRRFDVGVGDPNIEFASTYEQALIEDAVQAATRAEEPYTSSSPSVADAIERVIERLRSTRRMKVANVVADLATEEDQPLSVVDVRIWSVPNGAERDLELEIPGAGFLLEREDAIALGGGGTAILVIEDAGTESFEEVSARGRQRLRRLVSCIRLGTGSTARPMADVSGEPGTCRLIGPVAYPLRHGGRLTFVHRSVTVGPTDTGWMSALAAALDAATVSPLPSPMVALGRLNRVLDEPGRVLADQAIDLATGLEAALAGTRSESEIGLRLRNRAAAFLSSSTDHPGVIYSDVKLLYTLRSAFVHGSALSEDDVWRLLGKVSAAQATKWRGEQYELVLDRWRDLLRRAILFRLAAGLLANPIWPIAKDKTDVDAVIVDAAETARWRSQVAGYWFERGLTAALEPPLPLQGIISGAAGSSAGDAANDTI
jgi:hypothetical protein